MCFFLFNIKLYNVNFDAGKVYELAQDRAFYRKDQDHIVLPLRGMFKDGGSFVATLIHEMGHSTGHASRLDWTFGTSFGDSDYAKEELRAELSALFTEVDLGVDPSAEVMEDHSDYLKSWIGALRNDPNELFRACADAEKISERLKSRLEKVLEKDINKHEENQLEVLEQISGVIEKVPVDMIQQFQKDAALDISTSIEAEKLPIQGIKVRKIRV